MRRADHHGKFGFKAQALLKHQVHLAGRAQGEHLKAVWMARHHVQGVDADGAGRAEHGDALCHGRSFKSSERKAQQHHGQREHGQQSVHAVEHATVSGQQATGILGAGAALDQGLH